MKIAVLSDIHANLNALRATLVQLKKRQAEAWIFLGDYLTYGMRPNEVMTELYTLKKEENVLCMLAGNHEMALELDPEPNRKRFSTEDGRFMVQFADRKITPQTRSIVQKLPTAGKAELQIGGVSILCCHASLSDPFWGHMTDKEFENPEFARFDWVLCGHSHVQFFAPQFYQRPGENSEHLCRIINPGAVGFPSGTACAQCALIDTATGSFSLISVPYDYAAEQRLYPSEVPASYRDRLSQWASSSGK